MSGAEELRADPIEYRGKRDHPIPVKILAVLIVIGLPLVVGFMIWRDISQEHYLRVASLGSVAVIGALQSRRKSSRTNSR